VDSNGLVTGWTPQVDDIGDTFTFQIQLAHATAGSDIEVWNVVPEGLPPIINDVPDGQWEAQKAYVKQLTLFQGTPIISWSLLQGPGNSTVDADGQVSGWTPQKTDVGSNFPFNVQASNGLGSDTEDWTIHVVAVPPTITTYSPNPDWAIERKEYITTLSLESKTPPTTPPVIWSVVSSTPNAPGLTVTAANGDGTVANVSGWTPGVEDIDTTFTITISASNASLEGGDLDTETWDVIVAEGFNSNYVYGARNDANKTAGIEVVRESDDTFITRLLTGEEWVSITFSGTEYSDTRCFLYYNRKGTTVAQTIREIDALGRTVKQATLASLGCPYIGDWGPVRWSKYYPNKLFVSTTVAGPHDVVYEIDLDLMTLYATYEVTTGVSRAFTDIAIDDHNGDIYLMDPCMKAGTVGGWAGEVHRFSPPSTTPTMVIDGQEIPEMNGAPGNGTTPQMLAYRDRGLGSSERTLIVGLRLATTILEFYLDTSAYPVDANGNLSMRGYLTTAADWPWHGQQASATGTVWMGCTNSDDMEGETIIDTNTSLAAGGLNYWDIDSPADTSGCPDPVFDVDEDGDVDVDDFAQFQRCITTGLESPPALSAVCNCFDIGDDNADHAPDRDGDIDEFDLARFLLCTSGPGVDAQTSCDNWPFP
jgi:hypothetical protein